jgi:hypothetical protein
MFAMKSSSSEALCKGPSHSMARLRVGTAPELLASSSFCRVNRFSRHLTPMERAGIWNRFKSPKSPSVSSVNRRMIL